MLLLDNFDWSTNIVNISWYDTDGETFLTVYGSIKKIWVYDYIEEF